MNRSVWFPGDLAARVEAEASRLDRSFNWVVVKTLESALSDGSSSPPESRTFSPHKSADVVAAGAASQSSAPTRASDHDLPDGVQKGAAKVKPKLGAQFNVAKRLG